MKRSFLAALCLLISPAALFAQVGHLGHAIDRNLIFPDFVVGGGVTTQIILMNPQPGKDLTGTLFFFKQDGTPLQVVSNGQTDTQLTVTLAPAGIQFVNVTGAGATASVPTVGWALFEVPPPAQGQDDLRTRVFGSVIFTTALDGVATGTVGVVVSRYQLGANRTIAVPVVVQGASVNTGVALVNAGADPMTLTFQLEDQQGTVVQQDATITPPISPLAPGHQVALFVSQLFPGFNFNNSNFQGSLVITTQQEGLVVTGLQTNNSLLTSVPVVLVPAQVPAAQTRTVTNAGFTFSPADITINAGDSIHWQLASMHDVVEVTQQTWNANSNAAKAGGFSTPFGGGTVTFDTPGTYYYVCSPHASLGMKGKITVKPL